MVDRDMRLRAMRLEEARQRALIISQRIRQRADLEARRLIDAFPEELDYAGQLEELAIAAEAWQYIREADIAPKLVFAHPALLQAHPQTSLHYRGIATLSLKRVQAMAAAVKSWEEGAYRRAPTLQRCEQVARTYNAVISVIITGSDGWTLENGYRNVLATIGITEDGALRNIVGQEGEAAVKDRISDWLAAQGTLHLRVDAATTFIGEAEELRMVYAAEPDIRFERRDEGGDWQIIATIEIKSGTDPAGALERLGAVQKSFEETPPRARNFAVLGVVTPEMRRRLDEMKVARDFSLYRILNDDAAWNDFAMEIFHYTLRIV